MKLMKVIFFIPLIQKTNISLFSSYPLTIFHPGNITNSSVFLYTGFSGLDILDEIVSNTKSKLEYKKIQNVKDFSFDDNLLLLTAAVKVAVPLASDNPFIVTVLRLPSTTTIGAKSFSTTLSSSKT